MIPRSNHSCCLFNRVDSSKIPSWQNGYQSCLGKHLLPSGFFKDICTHACTNASISVSNEVLGTESTQEAGEEEVGVTWQGDLGDKHKHGYCALFWLFISVFSARKGIPMSSRYTDSLLATEVPLSESPTSDKVNLSQSWHFYGTFPPHFFPKFKSFPETFWKSKENSA